MSFFSIFKKKEPTHAEKVEMAYRCYKAEMVGMLFPEGVPQADKIIRSLARVYDTDLTVCDAKAYYNILTTYTDILIRKIVTQSGEDAILSSLVVKHGDLVKTRAMAQQALNYTTINMGNHSFVLNNRADVDLLDQLNTSYAPDTEAKDSSGKDAEESAPYEEYYFENVAELAIYGKLHGKGKTVNWLKGTKYIDLCQKGYSCFEEGKYAEAIDILQESLAWNPIGLSARFEIVECYIQMKNFSAARQSLYTMADYLIEPIVLARFYRRLGYISVEEGQYLCAAACFSYSKQFEDHPSVQQELLYIRSKYEFDVGAMLLNPVPTLDRFQIPVLTQSAE